MPACAKRDPASDASRVAAEVELPSAEIAVFQAHIELIANGHAHAGDQLPRNGFVAVVEARRHRRNCETVLDARDADAAADIAVDAGVIAEIEKRISHRRQ